MTKPAHDTITATELVRNLSAAIDKVRMTGCSLYITKGSQTVAALNPPPRPGLPLTQLIALLEALPKLEGDAAGLARDVKNVRRKARLPTSPWD